MLFAVSAAVLAVLLVSLNRTKFLELMARAPALCLCLGAGLSLAYRGTGAPGVPSEWVAAGADVMLACLAFVAAAQFRVTRLAKACPASFWLTIGGAPVFLLLCGVAAFALTPSLSLSAAFLLAAALTINGAAFDRRAVANAPAPATIKAAVRLESAAALTFALPIAVFMEAAATNAPQGLPAATPMLETSFAVFGGFALGGGIGLVAAMLGNKLKNMTKSAIGGVVIIALAVTLSPLLGANPVIAAAAAGLLWGEETKATIVTRVRLRRMAEQVVMGPAFFIFGAAVAPLILHAELLSVVFAIATVTILRVTPRMMALRRTNLPRESQAFLAWFGGAPGAASALFLISLFDATAIAGQDTILTVGALAVCFGVFAARMTSRPLVQALLKETALARKRAMFTG